MKIGNKPALKKSILRMTFKLEKYVIYHHIVKYRIKLNCAKLLRYCYDFSFDVILQTEISLTFLEIYSEHSYIKHTN